MKTKRIILTLLLSAFIFVAFHDFVVQQADADTQIELAYVHAHNQSVCDVSVLHETIHNMMVYTNNSDFIAISSITFSPYFLIDSELIKKFKQNIDRPPIA